MLVLGSARYFSRAITKTVSRSSLTGSKVAEAAGDHSLEAVRDSLGLDSLTFCLKFSGSRVVVGLPPKDAPRVECADLGCGHSLLRSSGQGSPESEARRELNILRWSRYYWG